MPSNIFQITPYSSFRFVNENLNTDLRYNTLPFDDRRDDLNYHQKIRTNDTGFIMQCLSDFPVTFEIWETCLGYDDQLVQTVPTTSQIIQDETFLAYTGSPDFSGFTEGTYYGKVTFIDENDFAQDYRTSPLAIAEDWTDTLLYEYTNTYNDKNVVFIDDNGDAIVFSFRVEGNFDEYQPSSDDVDYTDQTHDVEVLNNTPYDKEKNYIGTAPELGGIPDWAIKKANLIFTLNKVSIDGQYYSRVEGSAFTPVNRPTNQLLKPTFWSIDIIPNLNFNLGQLKTGDIPTGDIIVVRKAYPEQPPYPTITGSFIVAGIFKINSNLIRIALTNTGGDVFTMLIGITLGGSEIRTFNITGDLTQSLHIEYLFNSTQTVYVSVPDGVNLKCIFEYSQYDVKPSNPPGASGVIPKGFTTVYTEVVDGDFALDFNVGTGLGMRDWTGWCLSGTNGTPDRTGKYSRGWNRTIPSARGTNTGNADSSLELSAAQLPVNNIPFNIDYKGGSAGFPVLSTYTQGEGNPLGPININTGGEGDPIDISPDTLEDVWVVKLT